MKKIITFLFCLISIGIFAQGYWTQKSNYAGAPRSGAVRFAIQNKGYVGLGSGYIDFWEYDPSNNAWTQKADFSGTAGYVMMGFSITGADRGYAGLGSTNSDFWEYNPYINIWTQKANFSGIPRGAAVGFAIGNKGYVGTGADSNGELKDFWEYDPLNDTWTQKTDFGGTARDNAVGFSILNKGYIATGHSFNAYNNDLWEYDPSIDTWTQKANLPGPVRTSSCAFSIGSKGYLGTGYGLTAPLKDFWEYDPFTNTWLQKQNFPGGTRWYAAGLSIGSKGYVGLGSSGTSGSKDFWQFNPWSYGFIASTDSGCAPLSVTFTNTTNDPEAYFYEWLFISPGNSDTVIVYDTLSTTVNYVFDSSGVYSVQLNMLDSFGNNMSSYTMPIYSSIVPAPAICMVTVDSLSKNSVVIWDKTNYSNIDSFIVYRETSTNVYSRIGSVPYDSLSLFVDTVRTKYFPNTGDPNTGTYRYKLQAHDTCGYYSPLSAYHNTIFIANNNGTFLWPQLYTIEGASNPVTNYALMRDNTGNGNWIVVNSVAGTQQIVTDPLYSIYQATASWRVETQWSISCNPTKVNPAVQNFNSSRSNIFSLTTGVNEYYNNPLVSISPNPFSETAIVQFANSHPENCEFIMMDIYGREVKNLQIPVGEQSIVIDRDELSSGMYFYKVSSKNAVITTGKLIIE